MIFQRLGVITDEVSQDLHDALDWSKKHDLTHVEIRMVDNKNIADMDNGEIARIRDEVSNRGLFVSAIASPLFKCPLDSSRSVEQGDVFGQKEENAAAHHVKLERVIEIAGMLQTNRIRIFSFWREQDPLHYEEEIIAHLSRAAQVANEHNIQLLLENEPSCNGGYAEEVGRMVRRVHSPALKVLWDPGNEHYGGRIAFPSGYQTVRNELAHIHLKDVAVFEDGKRKAAPIGSGDVPYVEQFRALEADGYNGLYTIETHYIPEGGTAKDGTTMALEGLRKLLVNAGLA